MDRKWVYSFTELEEAERTAGDWEAGFAKSLGVFLNGDALPEPDPRGQRPRDDSFLLLFNAHHEPVAFTLPGGRWGELWALELGTDGDRGPAVAAAGSVRDVEARSMQVLRRV